MKSNSYKRSAWTEEEIDELRLLFEKFKVYKDFSAFDTVFEQDEDCQKQQKMTNNDGIVQASNINGHRCEYDLTTMIEESTMIDENNSNESGELMVTEKKFIQLNDYNKTNIYKDVENNLPESKKNDVLVLSNKDSNIDNKNDEKKTNKLQNLKKNKKGDIIDAILESLSTRNMRNRRQVIRQLKSMVSNNNNDL